MHTHTHTLFNGPLCGTTEVSRYQKGKTNLDFTEARDSEWQWHQLRHMQICTSLQTNNHASTPPLSFLQARCPSCHPTNRIPWMHSINYVWASCYLFTEKNTLNITRLLLLAYIKHAETIFLWCVLSGSTTGTAVHFAKIISPLLLIWFKVCMSKLI